jgi:TonB family protein
MPPVVEAPPTPLPFRKQDEKHSTGSERKAGIKTTVTPIEAPQTPASSKNEAAAGLSFSMPESGSLVTRLTTAIQQFARDFGKPAPRLRAGDTGEFRFLLADESLPARIKREVKTAAVDFKSNPRAFLAETLRGEGSTQRRRRMMQAGFALAMIAYAFIFSAFLLATLIVKKGSLNVSVLDYVSTAVAAAKVTVSDIGGGDFKGTLETNEKGEVTFSRLPPGKYLIQVDGRDCEKREREVNIQGGEHSEQFKLCSEQITMLQKNNEPPPKELLPKGKGNVVGGSKPKPEKASGGGGGGRNQPTPPSKGNLPQASLTQQIVMPNPEPPKIKNPSLPVAMTVYADPKALPEFKGGPIGLPTGVEGPPSSGPGSGAGIGSGSGTGVGTGRGGGVGPGEGGNTGGGSFGLGGGGIEEAGKNGAGSPKILYKERAKYTEEARQNKVQGTVLLSAVFTADGRITQIKVVRSLPDGLVEKAIEAAQKIRFQPATKNGVPITVRATLEFNFALY